MVLLVAGIPGCVGIDAVPILGADACEASREAEVTSVRDGDTFEVEDGEAVRMLGVNSPEIAHDSTEVSECFGDEAAAWATERLTELTVTLSFDTTCEDTYGRTLAYAWTTDEETLEEILLNEEIVELGYARVYEDFDDIRLADRLYAAQDRAQATNAGLWAVCE
jgi:micrococcal nuclease